MIYRQVIEIPSYLCDVDDRLHVWAAVRLCQEVTEYHGNATGIGFNTLLTQNRAWVITRAFYDIKRLPDAFERVQLKTWSRGNNGLLAFRDYTMTAENGENLLSGTSAWAMIDMTQRRVLRLNELIANYENHPDKATEYDVLPRLTIPKMAADDTVMRRTVGFAMLDHTQHVNNSEYIRLIFDYLYENGVFRSNRQFSLDLSYHMESRQGEELDLMSCADGRCFNFQINNPRALSVTAQVIFRN